MITLFTGAPGAGKTAALVDYLSKLDGTRPIYVDGLDGLTLPHTPCDASQWPEEVPDGAILVVDEAQRVWRPRGPGAKVPHSVSELETHRHRGVDVFLTTQAPTLLDINVRNLVGRHVHIRDVGILGRYWYEWPEVSTAMNWKTCVNRRSYKLPKKAFSLYKSASIHTPVNRSVPPAVYVSAVAVLAFLVLVFYVFGIFNRVEQPKAQNVVTLAPGEAHPHQTSSASPASPESFIDDRIAWIPRVSNRPESAPAFDKIRVVTVMPRIVGGYCSPSFCKCVTQQGTDAGLSQDECRSWHKNPPFDPYRTIQTVQAQPFTPQATTPPPSL